MLLKKPPLSAVAFATKLLITLTPHMCDLHGSNNFVRDIKYCIIKAF